MKKILSVNNNSNAAHIGLLIGRIVIAALMLTHGIPKMQMLFSGDPVKFLPVLGMSAELSLALTVFAEVFCSVFLLAGFATRLVTIPLIITMLVAVLIVHGADPIAVKEPALHYLLVYLLLFLMGSGKYSIDFFLQTKTQRTIKVRDKEPALVFNKYSK